MTERSLFDTTRRGSISLARDDDGDGQESRKSEKWGAGGMYNMTELLIDAGYSNWFECCQISCELRPGPLLLLWRSRYPRACSSASCPSEPTSHTCCGTEDPDASLGALEDREGGRGEEKADDVEGWSCWYNARKSSRSWPPAARRILLSGRERVVRVTGVNVKLARTRGRWSKRVRNVLQKQKTIEV